MQVQLTNVAPVTLKAFISKLFQADYTETIYRGSGEVIFKYSYRKHDNDSSINELILMIFQYHTKNQMFFTVHAVIQYSFQVDI